jgi:hypothetical protein
MKTSEYMSALVLSLEATNLKFRMTESEMNAATSNVTPEITKGKIPFWYRSRAE